MSRDYLTDWAKEIERKVNIALSHPEFGDILKNTIFRDMNKLLDALNAELKEKQEIEEEREERHE